VRAPQVGADAGQGDGRRLRPDQAVHLGVRAGQPA
jgi:hypothetical protein